MRYLRVVIVIIFFVTLFSPLVCAEDVYMWTDEEGVVHITDDPHRLPPGGNVETIRHRNRSGVNEQSLPGERQGIGPSGRAVEEKEAVGDKNKGLSEDPRRRELERNLERAREEYNRSKELVERRRRDYSRKSTRHNRDQYRHALDELAKKREKLRELERQK